MTDSVEEKARIVSIRGSTVEVKGLSSYRMGEITYIGEERLVGEIIEIEFDFATVQVYEPLEGLKINDPVYPSGKSLSAELGPGLLTNIFDGIQRPLEQIKKKSSSSFIGRGIQVNALDREKKWLFEPNKELAKGHILKGGDVLGFVQETDTITSKIIAPPNTHGELISLQDKGEFRITDPIVELKELGKKKSELSMMHEWPVRVARPFQKKLPVHEPLVTGQRIIDMFFPIAKGGTAAIPGGFGTGKCVDGKTPILLSNGLTISIEDLFSQYISKNSKILKDSEDETILEVDDKNLEIFSFDKNTAKLVKKKVTNIYRGETDSIVKITSKKGRSISVTPIHKLQIFDGEKVIEKEARNIHVGDYLLCPQKLNLNNPKNLKIAFDSSVIECNLRITEKDDKEKISKVIDEIKNKHQKSLKSIAEDINLSYDVLHSIHNKKTNPSLEVVKIILDHYNINLTFNTFKTERRSKTVRIPNQVTNELAEFLGLLLSDGRLSLDRVIHFYNNSDLLRDRFSLLAEHLFSIESKEIISNTVKTAVIYSKPLTSFLVSLGVPLKKKSRNASIPHIFMQSDNEVLVHFLNAYISGDGYVSNYTLEISTASSEMSSNLGYVLSRLGIIYRITRKTIKNHTYYRIAVEGSQLQELGELMKFCGVTNYEKTEKIYEYANSQISHFESSNAIPIKKQIIITNHKQILENRQSSDRHKALQLIKNAKQNQKTTKGSLETFVEVLKTFKASKLDTSIIENIRKIDYIIDLSEEFYFDQVKKIELIDKPQHVYDLTVPKTENFVGGEYPLILHNTVIQHQLSKWSDANVVIYIGCGERGNEMTDVLREFPKLIDPHTQNPLMDRTILVANVSNMPVAAREASIYMGITMAEYFRDQGLNVLLTADSTSRWAEALREIAGQLEEMPVEEGYPAYLGARLANFYERAGQVITIGSPYREGSINITAAVSPPGGDFSEPVTANTKRFVKTFWGLDPKLANRKHFPSINWLNSYSGYVDVIEEWALESGLEDWGRYRQDMLNVLQKDEELQHIVELIGSKALPADEQLIILVADIIKDGFLQQSAFDPVDSFCPIEKQMKMMKLMLLFHRRAEILIKNRCPISLILGLKSVQILKRMKEEVQNDNIIQMNKIEDYIHAEMEELGSKYGYRV